MSENIETRLQTLKTRRHEASRRRATAEAKLDEVAARKAAVHASLKEQGFDTPDEAAAEVQRLTTEVDEILDEIAQKVEGL